MMSLTNFFVVMSERFLFTDLYNLFDSIFVPFFPRIKDTDVMYQFIQYKHNYELLRVKILVIL